MKDNQVFFKIMVQDETISNHDFKNKVDWNVRYETPAGKSERLKWKSTFTAKKNGRKRNYYRVYLQYVRCIMAHSCCRQKRFHLNVKTKLIGMEGTRLLREKRVEGRPRRRMRRGGSRTARGKRVPEVEIDV
ncbi:hypothetical protein AM233_19145 [Bacillus sp. FJAT-22058]|nr:hypothetical protein AM233_19145 [Bacillus sp. FJAT-22058]